MHGSLESHLNRLSLDNQPNQLPEQPRFRLAAHILNSDETEEDDEEFEEPSYYCRMCAENIPILHSSNHQRECYNSEDNSTCPFCSRKRRNFLMEDHISHCAQSRGKTDFERNKAIYFYRSSFALIEKNVLEHRDYILNAYKRSLHLGNEPSFCYVCETNEQHQKGVCLHTLGGGDFKWRANRSFERNFLPHFEKYLIVVKQETLHLKIQQFERKWMRRNPRKLEDVELRQILIEETNRQSDIDNEICKKDKLLEVEKLINRQATILGNKMTWYRNHFLSHVVCNCR